MKALVKYKFSDGDVEVRDIPKPTVGPSEVLIATRAVRHLRFDVHASQAETSGAWEMELPVALGRESAGVVHAVGGEMAGWSVGDRVVCETAAQICGKCAYCRSGRYNVCPHRSDTAREGWRFQWIPCRRTARAALHSRLHILRAGGHDRAVLCSSRPWSKQVTLWSSKRLARSVR